VYRVTLTHDRKQAFAKRPINPAITIVANNRRRTLESKAVNAAPTLRLSK
jgi:hypothetical protein